LSRTRIAEEGKVKRDGKELNSGYNTFQEKHGLNGKQIKKD